MIDNYEKLNNTYLDLMKQAEAALSRRDALALIHQADKIRMEMCSMDEAKDYLCVHRPR